MKVQFKETDGTIIADLTIFSEDTDIIVQMILDCCDACGASSICVEESIIELELRELLPNLNIMSVAETVQ
jgi:hypothetical protein